MRSIPTRDSAPISPTAVIVLHSGFVVTGIVTTLIGPFLPILIARWSLSDQRAGLFFTAQFCGSMVGVASIGPLIKLGYRYTFACGFGLIAAGVAGLNLGYIATLAAVAVFGCGLGQTLSSANLWVAEIAKTRRVAALSILNLMWGIGAVASSPFVMLAQRHFVMSWLLYAIAACSALTAVVLAGTNLEPGTLRKQEEAHEPALQQNISVRSTVSLAALFFLYVGSENSVAGWVASLTKRTNLDSGDLWALAPMFFWGGLLAGRALVPLVPLRHSERTLLASGLILAAAGVCFLLRAETFASVALCVTAAGLGLAAIYPILIAWLVKAFGERSRRIGAVMFALSGMGGATLPWFVGITSTKTGSLRTGLLIPLAGCIAMLGLTAMLVEPVFREPTSEGIARESTPE